MSATLRKVLIADDNPAMLDAFKLIFERAGYETVALASASSILSGTAILPDIYILDKQLSGVDGLEVCRIIKGQAVSAHIPVVVISATPHVEALAKEACADGYLEKPFRQRELLDLVKTLLAGHSDN